MVEGAAKQKPVVLCMQALGASAHEAIGTGRARQTGRQRIDAVIADKKLGANKIVERAMWIANDRSCRLHLFMPIGPSAAHASMEHLRAILRLCEAHDVRVVLHAFLDETPEAPRSALKRLEALELELEGRGVIGTLSGQAFAMDRSGDWEKTQKAYAAIVRGEAKTEESLFEALQAGYRAKQTDGTLVPVRIGAYEGMVGSFMSDFAAGQASGWSWFGEEVGLFMTHRPDRVAQLASMMVRRNVPAEVVAFLTDRGKAVYAFDEYGLLSLVGLDPALEVLAAFPDEPAPNTLGEVIARAGLSQIRIADPERSLHVTRFFEGAYVPRREREEVRIVPAERVAEEARSVIREGSHDVVIVSLAGAEEADAKLVAAATEEKGGALFVAGAGADEGDLADVAPKLLEALGLGAPAEMTGRSQSR